MIISLLYSNPAIIKLINREYQVCVFTPYNIAPFNLESFEVRNVFVFGVIPFKRYDKIRKINNRGMTIREEYLHRIVRYILSLINHDFHKTNLQNNIL